MREAVVALVIKDGLILAISRRNNKTKFGLIGGKVDEGETLEQALIRETLEESGVTITKTTHIYSRVELGDGPNGEDFKAHCFYANEWHGEPSSCEEGEVKWLTKQKLLSLDNGAFVDYNRTTLEVFEDTFPNVYIKGE